MCMNFWSGDIWCTLISRNDSHFKAISCSNKIMANSWALKTINRWISFLQRKFCDISSVLILMKIIPGTLLTHKSYIKSTFKMWLFWKLDWVTKHLHFWQKNARTEGHLDGELDLLNFWIFLYWNGAPWLK